MMRVHAFLAATAVILAGLAVPAAAQGQENMAHAHIGHVMSGWKDTPDKMGLLPTAEAEAEVAATHIGYALSDPDDLGNIKLHTEHVLHAVDPSEAAQGPGHGYGLIKAAKGVADHIGFAAAADGATENVELHSEHVSTSASNVAEWGRDVVELGTAIRDADSADAAAEKAREIKRLVGCIQTGCDADGDGTITWEPGEGGLEQAELHMGYMMAGEGITP